MTDLGPSRLGGKIVIETAGAAAPGVDDTGDARKNRSDDNQKKENACLGRLGRF